MMYRYSIFKRNLFLLFFTVSVLGLSQQAFGLGLSKRLAFTLIQHQAKKGKVIPSSVPLGTLSHLRLNTVTFKRGHDSKMKQGADAILIAENDWVSPRMVDNIKRYPFWELSKFSKIYWSDKDARKAYVFLAIRNKSTVGRYINLFFHGPKANSTRPKGQLSYFVRKRGLSYKSENIISSGIVDAESIESLLLKSIKPNAVKRWLEKKWPGFKSYPIKAGEKRFVKRLHVPAERKRYLLYEVAYPGANRKKHLSSKRTKKKKHLQWHTKKTVWQPVKSPTDGKKKTFYLLNELEGELIS